MRKWVNRAWAKAAAFALTLVFAALTALGGAGIAVLVSYDVFLDDGAHLRQTLYQEQCYDSLSMANDYLCAQLDSVGLLDRSYYFVNTDASATAADYNAEAAQQLLSELPRLFADAFSRELSSCQLVVSDPDTGETYLANFDLTEGDKLLYDTQELYVYHLSESTGFTAVQVAITATLLEKSGQAPSYSYLVCSWLVREPWMTVPALHWAANTHRNSSVTGISAAQKRTCPHSEWKVFHPMKKALSSAMIHTSAGILSSHVRWMPS